MKIQNLILSIVSIALLLSFNLYSQDQNKIRTVTENFDKDPGWENNNNRIECTGCRIVNQDFGWSATNHNGSGKGEIGGTIWRSTTPAYYAMPIGKPLNFRDTFSASGKLSVIDPPREGYGFYIGFFNPKYQAWRVWPSCGFRIGKMEEGKARFFLDYKTGTDAGAILNPDLAISGDGSVHTWELKYEPNKGVSKSDWPDPLISKIIKEKGTNVHTDTIWAALKKYKPGITKEKVLDLLKEARDAGLVDDWYRKGIYHLWTLIPDIEKIKGRITFTFDGRSVSYYLIPGHESLPSEINRFGIYNMQIYTGKLKFYLSDLVINQKKIDLSENPHWEGYNNKVTFVERDFHARQNFGYTQTNWAGKEPGEIGGEFWGTEVNDPSFGFYADNVGKLSLNDRIKFSGMINFVKGAVDGRMLIGYFNKYKREAPIEGEYKGNPPNQFMGIEIMDQTRLGYTFTAVCSPEQKISFEKRGPVIIPDQIRRHFTFDYNPNMGKAGRITVTLDNNSFTADLTSEQRKEGALFDHFGLLNPRKGGKYVEVYFDDLSYSVRRNENDVKWHKQKIIEVPYPEWGRKYK